MKLLVASYMGLYLLITLVTTVYSYRVTKKMTGLLCLLALSLLGLLALTLYFYLQSYQVWQMLSFALAFTAISSLYLYNGSQAGSDFTKVMLFSFGRFLLHFQLLVLLYIFR